ncbi:MAG: glycosyl hydrolase-related protein [Clostridia bacterium]|nr:glycosyl hydrolase-related protein [Clostridia bacterium]
MLYEPLKNKVYDKLEAALHIYNKLIYNKVGELEDAEYFETKEHLRSVPAEGWKKAEKGDEWGGEWNNRWIKGFVTVTEELAGKKLYTVSEAGGVEQLYFINGVPKGLFNSKNRDFIGGNHCAQLIGTGKAGDRFSLAFECYAGHFCVGDSPYENYEYPDIPMPTYMHTYNGVDICTKNEDVNTLVFDIRELLGAYKYVDKTNFIRARAMRALDKVNEVLVLDPKHSTPEKVSAGVKAALEITRPMFAGTNSRIFGKVGIIGHSHMDTAWLWPVSETVRKCARTYANAMHLMEQYPTYKFIQSSALHCEWMKDYYPDIFAEMQKRVKEGRYEPNGGVYVECDCNVTSGELMIRQFLKGQQFTRKYFDYTADSFWLPDTFGYNGNIPQIMRGCEVKYFYTTKISWNEQNRFPYESFVWKGIDSSEVLTHYNKTHCFPDVEHTEDAVNGIQLKDTTDMRLVAFGYGDGGGGPTPGMIEAGERVSHMDGMPEVEVCTISEFMKELETQKENLPVFNDELYLELHRGTLTQMHEVKRKNRKSEFAMRNMEYFNTLSGKKANENSDKWIKTLLKNQFHDILPGTCITPVYELYNKEMAALLDDYKNAADEYAAGLTDGDEKKVTLFNTLSFKRNYAHAFMCESGYAAGVPSQRYEDVCGRKMLAVGKMPIDGFSTAVVELADNAVEAASAFKYDGKSLETPFAKVVFDEHGYMASFIDKKSGRELKKKNGLPLGVLLMSEDLPDCWDNWDLEKDAIAKLKPVYGFKGSRVITDGAVEFRIRNEYELDENSSLKQDVVFYADSPRVDFHTLVDWSSKHRLLKAGFDLDINASRARNEIQYGYVERPTTANNTLEYTKFEVCNYKYTDISELRFGAALLNDCKYGVTVADCNLRLSLHRGGTHPDVTGDKGVHEMTYAFLPHSGNFSAENTVYPAYELNVPAYAVKGAADVQPIVKIDAPNVICEVVKPAEDGSDAYVLRLYECEGTATKAALTLKDKPSGIVITNMLEDEKEVLPASEKAELAFGAFEIKTLKIYR